MAKNSHIWYRWILGVLLSVWVVPVSANEAEIGGLRCGDTVTISATPEPGYRFVQWSDGNTDNPRDIEVTKSLDLTAEYERYCIKDPVPVVWIYSQILLVDVDSLQRLGYTFSEQDVSWYRIVGEPDYSGGEPDDELVGIGHYFLYDQYNVKRFYVVVETEDRHDSLICSTTLIGTMEHVKRTLPAGYNEQELQLIPNQVGPGGIMQLMGLKPTEQYTIDVYDAMGRKLENFSTINTSQCDVTAQYVPGCYIVRVTNSEGKSVLRYIVKQ